MDRKKLAQIIREARGDRSQGRFARDLGVNPGTLRNWELADSEPSLDNLKAIASATGRNLLQLISEITGDEPEALPEPNKAEDAMPIVSQLPLKEQFRLAQIVLNRIADSVGIDLEED